MTDYSYAQDQFTSQGLTAFNLMLDYSYKYPKNFFGNPKVNVRHSLIVRDFSIYLQKLTRANLEIVEVAALFHDLGKISTVEGHEELIVKLIQKHQKDLKFEEKDLDLILKICSEDESVANILEYKILHDSDNLAFLYDGQYQEAYYSYVGTKDLLFSKRMTPKFESLKLEPAKLLGKALYENAQQYWNNKSENATTRYRPDIEGKDLASFIQKL